MSLQVEGVDYWRAREVCAHLQISRQTLWRWRQQGKVPTGHRYRDNSIIFTEREVEEIRAYANRIESLDLDMPRQVKRFNGRQRHSLDGELE